MENKKNIGLGILLMILVLIIGILIGYIAFSQNNGSQHGNNIEENIEQDKNNQEEENIPYLDNLISITYTTSGFDEGTFKSRINDKETMKKVLSIFKNKTIVNEQPNGLGGAGYQMLTLEYETSKVEIWLPALNLIKIDNQYYDVNYEGDNYHTILEDIFK